MCEIIKCVFSLYEQSVFVMNIFQLSIYLHFCKNIPPIHLIFPLSLSLFDPTNTSLRSSLSLHLLRLHRKQLIHMELRFSNPPLQLVRPPIEIIAVLQPQRSQIVRHSEFIHRYSALAVSLILRIDEEPIANPMCPFSPSAFISFSLPYASRLSIDSSNERVLLTDNGHFAGLESTISLTLCYPHLDTPHREL